MTVLQRLIQLWSPKTSEGAATTTLQNQMSCKIKNVPVIYKQTLAQMLIRIPDDLN